MRDNRKSRVRGRSLAIALGASLVVTPVAAGGKYLESETPVFPEVQPDRALVFVVREEAGRFMNPAFKVFLDDEPVGVLPARSYMAVQSKPGQRLLWGPRKAHPQWFEFRARETYLIRLVEQWVKSGQSLDLVSTTYVLEDPAVVKDLVRRGKLPHVSLTQEGIEDMREVVAKKFLEIRASVGDPPPPAGAATTVAASPLPAIFRDIAFRRDKGLKIFEARGVLTIGPDLLEFVSGSERVSVPVKSIRSVFTGGLGVNHSSQWVIVEYEASGSTEMAGFLSFGFLLSGVVDQPLLSTIKSAVEASRRGGPTPEAGPGDAARQAAAAPETRAGLARPPLLERVARVVERAEAAETGDDPSVASDQLLEEVASASADTESLLASHPDHVQALFLAVRLGRAREILSPISVSSKEDLDQMESQRRERVDRLRLLLDRVLVLEPENAEAYYWKARLYGLRHFAVRGGQMVYAFVDLEEAIRSGRRAVALAPDNLTYREALAQYLVSSDQRAEAMELMRLVADGQHSIYLLLKDRESLPLPPGSTLLSDDTERRVQEAIARGWHPDYPYLRLHQYVLPMTVAELEAFYRRTWPDFHFLKLGKEKIAGASVTSWVQWMRQRGTEWYPVSKESDIPEKPPLPEGIRLTANEFRKASHHAPFPVPVGDVFCIMTVRNFRPSTVPMEASRK